MPKSSFLYFSNFSLLICAIIILTVNKKSEVRSSGFCQLFVLFLYMVIITSWLLISKCFEIKHIFHSYEQCLALCFYQLPVHHYDLSWTGHQVCHSLCFPTFYTHTHTLTTLTQMLDFLTITFEKKYFFNSFILYHLFLWIMKEFQTIIIGFYRKINLFLFMLLNYFWKSHIFILCILSVLRKLTKEQMI